MRAAVKTEWQRKRLIDLLGRVPLPFTVSIKRGRNRSLDQNRLQHVWIKEIAEQLDGWDVEDVRAHCKLHIGVPILRAEDEEWRKAYDSVIRPLPYEAKLECMKAPLDFPVTRRMSVKQMQRYLEEMARYWAEHGIVLSDPDQIV